MMSDTILTYLEKQTPDGVFQISFTFHKVLRLEMTTLAEAYGVALTIVPGFLRDTAVAAGRRGNLMKYVKIVDGFGKDV